MPVLGRLDSASALSDMTTQDEARRFDATRDGHVIDRHGHSRTEHRAATTLASAARDHAELAQLLQMCGLMQTPKVG